MIFSIKKGVSLAKGGALSDLSRIIIGNSVISFSESNSERFCLSFLFEFDMCVVFFLLVLCTINHHKVQLLQGIYKEEYQFALIETGIHWPVYSCQEGDFKPLLISGFQYSKPRA